MKYKNIEAERARRGMSLEQIASLIGISRKTFYNWCRSGTIPESAIEKMSVIFNCSTNYLAECDEETFFES